MTGPRFSVQAVVSCPRCRADLDGALGLTPAALVLQAQRGALPRCLKCGHTGRGLPDFLVIVPASLTAPTPEG